MDARIRAFDWSKTPLGAMPEWPQSLRTTVNILLSSRYAMWMFWGPGMTMLYNDAYRPTLGIKHPWALGASAREVWAEIWQDIRPRIETVVTTGQATYDEGLMLFLERSGFPEETYHTFSYSPLTDESGRISGMLCVVTEETERLIGERRVETLREVASGLAAASTEEEIFRTLRRVLGRNWKDLPFTLTYLFDGGGAARLACSSGIAKGHPLAPARIEPQSDLPWPAHSMLTRPGSRFLESLAEQAKIAPLPAGNWNKAPQQASMVPIRQQGQEGPAGFFIAGINPYRHYTGAYSGFIDLLCGQMAAALSNARGYEAERRRAEALAEIDRAKTAFFSNVSHELRTPLTLLLSPVEELLAGSGSDAPAGQREMLELVHRNGLRLQKLVNSLLDFSRIEAGRMRALFEPVDLASYTAELAANFESAMERAGLRFVIDCAPVTDAWIDRDMWEKIVLNLLSNALKFTFEGSVRILVRTVGECVELKVEDTGTGIPEEELPHIFERFHRVEGARGRTIEGTGIGLALVQELVKLHGGTISVESVLGKGSAFLVSIPLGNAHLPANSIGPRPGPWRPEVQAPRFVEEALRWLPPGSSAQDARPRYTGERILLAEDNADMREYVSRLLRQRFDVTAAPDGRAALAAALENPPDLVLSDVMMPGLSGFGLLEELRKHQRTRTVPVILLSARAGEESRFEGLGAGADDYLVKPFTSRELLARVGAHLAMKKRREDAEEALRESQATLQSFYDSSPFLMGIAELDGAAIISVYSNRAAAEFIGTEAHAAAGLTGRELGIPAEVERIWLAQYRRSQSEGAAIRFEYEHPKPAGNRWLSVVVNYLGAGSAGRPRFSFIAEDVTEKRRADELVRRSNDELRRANADLEQFAYTASHDLQEPLRQVAIYSQLLDRRYAEKLDEKGLEYLEYCVEGAHRMEMLISDLLAYSQAGKAGAESGEPVDVNEVIATVRINLAAAIEESQAVFRISSLPRVSGDPVPLTQLFQNLISNAIKYRSDKTPEISISAEADESQWRFAVKDNGIGIPHEFRKQVFGIFKRLHDRSIYPGNGIGLAICQKIVDRYGGRIWVESEPGEGSTFYFTLPKVRAN